jgi:hypothetical protein
MTLCKDFCTDLTTQNVPSVPRATGLLCLILNILPFPGLGSVIAGLQANSSSTVLIGVRAFLLVAHAQPAKLPVCCCPQSGQFCSFAAMKGPSLLEFMHRPVILSLSHLLFSWLADHSVLSLAGLGWVDVVHLVGSVDLSQVTVP